jgi:glycosyltransferase involved in cell wall biosynthesis
MTESLVSIIIPTYNRARFLKRAIFSILNQTYPNFELLIIDDGSTDNTQEIVNKIADTRVTLIRHPENRGQCAALNTGIAHAKGEFIGFLDSDDEWLPGMVEQSIRKFHMGNEKLGLVYVLSAEVHNDGAISPSRFKTAKGNIYRQALTQGYVAPSITLMVKKTCIDQVGGFDEQFVCFQDDDLCFRLSQNFEVDFVPEILALIHKDADGQLTRIPTTYAYGWLYLLNKYETDILKICEKKVLVRHYLRAVKLFFSAGIKAEAYACLKKSYALLDNPFSFLGQVISVTVSYGFHWFERLIHRGRLV